MGVFSKLKGIFYDEVEVEDEEKDELEKVYYYNLYVFINWVHK